MPAGKRRRIGWRRASQELKSPTTATRSALGAHTAKRTPSTPSTVTMLAPSDSASSKCRPSLNRCRSSSPKQRAEGVGILGLLLRFRPFYAQQIGRSVGHGTFEQALHLAFDQPPQRCTIAAPQHLDRLCARQEDADRAAGRAVVRTQHLEGIAMTCRRQRFGVGAIQPTERRCRHGAAPSAGTRRRLAMRARPPTGMASQVGRLAAS